MVGRAVSTMIAAVIAATTLGTSAQAEEGYWRFTGYATTPPQSQFDETDRGVRQMGRVSETRATGAFQPANSGAGTVDLFFKNDDIDRRLYLTTLKFSFTTGVEMRTLTPGQKLHFNGTLVMGGNALSKSLPATGNGGVSADNGDYFISMAGAIDQPASSSGDFIVPRGGDTLTLHAMGHLGAYGGLAATMHINYVWVPGAAPLLGSAPAVQPPQGPPVEIFSNGNPGGVGNGGRPPSFNLDRPTRITSLQTYHWNFGHGRSPPGEIGLVSESGQRFGPWRAAGASGQGGVPDAFWIVNPDILLPAGRYQVTDSDPPTWAQNGGTDGEGMVTISGVAQ